jgi:hypothetical protein
VVSFGAAAALFGLPQEFLQQLVKDRFGRYVELLPKNLQAVEAGMRYVEEHVPQRADYQLHLPPPAENVTVISGNQAVSLGALVAGCRFFAGYPITPATEIMEFLVAELPKVGGNLIQAEDEMAALGMVLGASFTGKKAMTSTSGPGFSLMQELLGLGIMAELPCVVADIQRAAPTYADRPAGDLYIAAVGGHGTAAHRHRPTSVEDCFYRSSTPSTWQSIRRRSSSSDTVLAVRPRASSADLSQVQSSIIQSAQRSCPERGERLRTLRADRDRRLADGHPRHGRRSVRRDRPGTQYRRPATLRRQDPSRDD